MNHIETLGDLAEWIKTGTDRSFSVQARITADGSSPPYFIVIGFEQVSGRNRISSGGSADLLVAIEQAMTALDSVSSIVLTEEEYEAKWGKPSPLAHEADTEPPAQPASQIDLHEELY